VALPEQHWSKTMEKIFAMEFGFQAWRELPDWWLMDC
jgi:hypothetical protein